MNSDGVVRPPAASALARLAREGVAHDVLWHEGGRAFARALFAKLKDELTPDAAIEDALSNAVSSAYASSSAPVGQREGWVACALTVLVRDVLRASLESDDDRALVEGAALAERIARAARARMGDSVPSGAKDGVANAARRAMAELHENALGTEGVPAITTAMFGHLRHGSSQLRTGVAIDAIARGAVTRADRSEHGDSLSAWTRADARVRRAVISASLTEAAVTLARASGREWSRSPDVSVGLARCAFGMLGAAGESAPWLLGASESANDARTNDTEGRARSANDPSESTAAIGRALSDAMTKSAAGGAPAMTATTESNAMSNATSNGNANNNGTPRTQQVLATLESDAQDAAWRLAGSQFVKLMRDPLVGLLSRHLAPGDESMRGRIAAFLDTEIGTAMLSALLSAALSSLPRAAGPTPDRLARELRVRAMTDAGDVVADLVMGPLRQVMALYLQDPGFTAPSPLAAPSLEAPRASAVGTSASATVSESA
ncbi:MAG: hypothetical protein U0269_30160 [Polyangiales bacterium]